VSEIEVGDFFHALDGGAGEQAKPCSGYQRSRPAMVSVDGWWFSGPIDRCGDHAESLMAELGSMGWTFPFYIRSLGRGEGV